MHMAGFMLVFFSLCRYFCWILKYGNIVLKMLFSMSVLCIIILIFTRIWWSGEWVTEGALNIHNFTKAKERKAQQDENGE